MVPVERIVATAVAEQVDIVGLSGLITPSLSEMVHVAQEMERLEKEFRATGNTSLTFSLDGFNVFNNGINLAVHNQYNSRNFDKIREVINKLDKPTPQVLIEAKILEIKLNDEFSFGVNWNASFTNDDGDGDFGIQGLLTPGNSGNQGFFFNYLEPRIQAQLRALEADGRVRNLASPKVVTLVNEEAEVIIGDRRGYRVTERAWTPLTDPSIRLYAA